MSDSTGLGGGAATMTGGVILEHNDGTQQPYAFEELPEEVRERLVGAIEGEAAIRRRAAEKSIAAHDALIRAAGSLHSQSVYQHRIAAALERQELKPASTAGLARGLFLDLLATVAVVALALMAYSTLH